MMKKLKFRKFFFAAILSISAAHGFAGPLEFLRPSEDVFKLNPVVDSVFVGTGVAAAITSKSLQWAEVSKPSYSESDVFDFGDVNPFDKIMKGFYEDHGFYNEKIDALSDVCMGAMLVAPLGLFAFGSHEWVNVSVMYSESVLWAASICEFLNMGTRRARPFMYGNPADIPEDELDDGSWAYSMPSSHTAIAWTSATFITYCVCQYTDELKVRIPVIASSYLAASGVAFLRMAAGCHFATDVLTGAAIGSAFGFLVPFAHHIYAVKSAGSSVQIEPMPMGFNVSVKL